jgi:hypothetical protein
MLKLKSQVSAPRNAFPPTPPGPEGSNGNGLLCVQWVAGAWLYLEGGSSCHFDTWTLSSAASEYCFTFQSETPIE